MKFWCLGLLLELAISICTHQVAGAAVTTTTIQDTVYRADGSVASGTLLLSWPAFSTPASGAVAAGSMTVAIGQDGFISVKLAPNSGAVPFGSYYTAVYHLNDGTVNTEYWLVPATAVTSIAAVRAQVVPAAVAVQTVTKQYVDSSVATIAGSFVATAGGTMSGPLTLNADPNSSYQAATKHYVDQQVSGLSAVTGNAVQRSGDTMTGLLTLAQDPQGSLDAATKQFVLNHAGTPNALPLTGGAMQGPITLTDGSAAASQSYVLAHSGSGVGATPVANSSTPIASALAAAQTGGAHAVTVLDGASGGFANSGMYQMIDLRSDVPAAPYSVKAFGAYCDTREAFLYATTAGANTFTVGNTFLSQADAGKTMVIVGSLNGVPAVWSATIATVTGNFTGTFSSSAPFVSNGSYQTVDIGHDDTAALQAALDAEYSNRGRLTLTFPSGNCLTHKLKYRGEGFSGIDKQGSQVTGFPGEDVFQGADPSAGGQTPVTNTLVRNLTVNINAKIDATKPWLKVDATDSVSNGTVLNRPAGLSTAWANNPISPGWFEGPLPNNTGAQALAGAATNNTTTLTVAGGLTPPSVGQQLVFPYLSTVFATTVSSVSGQVVTMASAYPGPTSAQVEFWAGSSAQNLAAPMGLTDTTLTLTNSIAPSPAAESSVAPYGLIQIDAEQIQYGNYNRSTGQFTHLVRGYNGTTAATHSASAVVVALNPFYPATPWPVTPTVNTGDTTPVGAAYYPAWTVGNSAFAWPDMGDAAGDSWDSWVNSKIENITVQQWPINDNAAPGGGGWNVYNNTGSFFFQSPPYATEFDNLNIIWTTYGPFEAPPTTHYHQWLQREPTGNGNSWKFLTVHAWHLQDFENEAIATFDTANMYSEDPNGTAGTGFIWSGSVDDQTGGGGDGACCNVVSNWYAEAEAGTGERHGPWAEFDASSSTYTQISNGGGETLFGGSYSNVFKGEFNVGPTGPLIVYGQNNDLDTTNVLTTNISGGQASNTFPNWGVLNFGSSNRVVGNNNTLQGSKQNLLPTGSRELFGVQNADFLRDGVATGAATPASQPVQDYKALVIYPDEMAAGNVGHRAQGLISDATAPVSGAAASCFAAVGQFSSCGIQAFDGIFAGMPIGNGQRIQAKPYTAIATFRSDAPSVTGTWRLSAWCAGGSVFTVATSPTITVTNQWQTFSMPVDFSAYATSGCGLVFDFLNQPSVTTTFYTSYLAFQPFADNLAVRAISGPPGATINVTSPLAAPALTLGGTLNAVHFYSTGSITPAAVTPASCADQSFAVSGVSAADNLGSVKPPAALGNLSVSAWAAAANTVTLHFCNASGASVTPPAGAYSFLAVH